jgi:hypothetical protein
LKNIVHLLVVAAALIGGNAFASTLTLTLVNSTIATTAGNTVTFQATAVNPSGSTTFLNADSITIVPPGLATDDSAFLNLWPLSLGAGESFGPSDLFSVTIPNPTVAGVYNGVFEILGGDAPTDSNIIGSANFSVNVGVPESPSATLAMLGIGLLVAVRLRQAHYV